MELDTLDLVWPELWVTLLWAGVAALLLLVALGLLARRWQRGLGAAPVANTALFLRAPRLRRRRLLYRVLLGLGAAAALCALAASALVASRPTATASFTPETRNRDIVLCLDVSGSMKSFDAQLLDTFDNLARNFAGERVALTIFDSSPLQVFPLTTDYASIRAQIASVKSGLRGLGGYAFDNATRMSAGSSRTGDGLAGCLVQFDKSAQERSRTIIFATDNRSYGDELVSIERASEIASERGVKIFAMNPVHKDSDHDAHRLRSAAEFSGGGYFSTGNEAETAAATQTIVQMVTSDPATVVAEAPITITLDAPDTLIWLLSALTLTVLLLGWRLRL